MKTIKSTYVNNQSMDLNKLLSYLQMTRILFCFLSFTVVYANVINVQQDTNGYNYGVPDLQAQLQYEQPQYLYQTQQQNQFQQQQQYQAQEQYQSQRQYQPQGQYQQLQQYQTHQQYQPLQENQPESTGYQYNPPPLQGSCTY